MCLPRFRSETSNAEITATMVLPTLSRSERMGQPESCLIEKADSFDCARDRLFDYVWRLSPTAFAQDEIRIKSISRQRMRMWGSGRQALSLQPRRSAS